MKICPRCQKTYTDESLNFCLEDGSVLTQASSQPPPTAFIDPPRQTQPQQSVPSQPGMQPQWNTAPQQYAQPPKKSSKTWIWVLLILGALVLMCGGGFAGLIYVGSQMDTNENTNTINSKATPPNKLNSNSNTNSNSTSDRTSINKLDLQKWVSKDQSFGMTEFKDGELYMTAKKKTDYFALAGLPAEMSVNADSRISVRNVESADTTMGFGLIFHSDSAAALKQGYALLIDSEKQRYRVVHHTPHKEDEIIKWTKSDLINDGSEYNTLEVRDKTGSIDIYINGTKVNSITNVYGVASGVVGIYSGGGVTVAFKDFEIRK